MSATNKITISELEHIAHLARINLSEEEKNSYDIMAWEITVGKEMLQQNANLMPIHQFWGTHLTMGQYASAESAQPFKTVDDYEKFHKRLDLYTVWIDSAIVYIQFKRLDSCF